ncbi:helix-turn-helix domain-containing protein [Enhygromyxa salina]|uniref:helix-turn-helix domain-containing protein n=1 Tax=Enhygromyxa salina TaxID=215803 RepID=UPI001F0A32C5
MKNTHTWRTSPPLGIAEQLLNTDEVATLLRVSRKAVYCMVDRGEIPGVTKLGRRL